MLAEHRRVVVAAAAGGVLLWALCVMGGSSQLHAAVAASPQARLAIIAEPAAQDLADVLAASLTDAGVVLLERQQIAAILQEQGLVLAGITVADSLKLGDLLKADGLVLLSVHKSDGGGFVALRLVAVAPGVVLWTSQRPASAADMSEWTALCAARLRGPLPKLRVSASAAIPMSVLNVRLSLDLESLRWAEPQLKTLLIHRLAHEPAIFVLERQEMGLLQRENDLAARGTEFWAGRYVLEGTIEPELANPQGITVRLRLAAPREGRTLDLEARGSAQNLPALADELVRRIMTAVAAPSAQGPWDLAGEARYFAQEAYWAERAKVEVHMVRRPAESAWVLGDRSRALAALYVRSRLGDACGFRYNLNFFDDAWADIQRYRREPPDVDAMRRKMEDAAEAVRFFLDRYERELAAERATSAEPTRGALAAEALHVPSVMLQWAAERGEKGLSPQVAQLQQLMREVDRLAAGASSRVPFDVVQHMAIYAPFWHSSPKEQMQAYRRVLALEHDALVRDRIRRLIISQRPQVPRLVAWEQVGGADLPQMWDGFLDELARSPEEGIYVGAYRLRAAENDQQRSAIGAALAEAMWGARDLIATGAVDASAIGGLHIRYGADPTGSLKDAVGRLLLYCARHPGGPASAVNTLLEQYASWQHTREELMEVNQVVLEYLARTPGAMASIESYRRRIMAAQPDLVEPAPLGARESGVLKVTRLIRPRTEAVDPALWEGMKYGLGPWFEGRLWVHAHNGPREFILAVELPSGEAQTIVVPPDIAAADDSPQVLVVAGGERIAVSERYVFLPRNLHQLAATGTSLYAYDRQTRRWRGYNDLPRVFPELVSGDYLYCRYQTTSGTAAGEGRPGHGMLRIHCGSGEAQVLSSSLRKPPVAPVDGLDIQSIIAGSGQEVLVAAREGVFAYDGLKDTWRAVGVVEYARHVSAQSCVPLPSQASPLRRFRLPDLTDDWVGCAMVDSRRERPYASKDLLYGESRIQTVVKLPVVFSVPTAELRRTFPEFRWPDEPTYGDRQEVFPLRELATPPGLLIPFQHRALWWFAAWEDIRAVAATAARRERHTAGASAAMGTDVVAFDAPDPIFRHLFLVDAEGHRRRLTDGIGDDHHPAWSPDGQSLVFVSNRDGPDDLFLMNADGSELRNLTGSWSRKGEAVFSPDGRNIAFTAGTPLPNEIHMIGRDGGGLVRLVEGPARKWSLSWSPDGKHIAYVTGASPGEGRLWVVDVVSRQARPVGEPAVVAQEVVFSADGKGLWIATRQPRPPASVLFSVNLDGSGLKRLPLEISVGRPAFRADGMMAVTRVDGDALPWSGRVGRELLIGREKEALRSIWSGDCANPAWRPTAVPGGQGSGRSQPSG